jgi:hypothetical protein
MKAFLLLLVATFTFSFDAAAAQPNPGDDVFVWFTSSPCEVSAPPRTPGSSAKAPRSVEYFEELYDASKLAVLDSDPPIEAKAAPCEWVRISGFFRWFDYYHYRGHIYADARSANRGGVAYIVENFRDRSVRRADLVGRKITLVGRFHNLCADAQRAEKASHQVWGLLFGPCHYGYNNGMMLSDAIVESVEEGGPQYVLGERNRKVIGDLERLEGPLSAELTQSTRAWAASAQKGPKAFVQELLRDQGEKISESDRQDLREKVESPDSYISYLARKPSFHKLDTQTAAVAIFYEAAEYTNDTPGDAVGCICLIEKCADEWPLQSIDAGSFLGEAACTRLYQDTKTKRWWW